jgi:hypothetical protein
MSGSKINNYSTIDNNIEELELTVDKCFNDRLTLTEMTTTTVPEIAAGSRVEVGGAFFKFDSDEAISTTDPVTSTTVADGIVYVMLKPAVDGLTVSAVMTATAPTWSDAKQGWYGTSTYAGYKYIPFCMTKATAAYEGKTIMFSNNGEVQYYAADATERTTTSTSIVDEDNLSITLPIKKGCFYEGVFLFESKESDKTNHAYIFFGNSVFTNFRTLIDDNPTGATAVGATKYWMVASGYDSATTYSLGNMHSIFLALQTTSHVFKMSWQTTAGTFYVKNRKLLIREIKSFLMP